MAVENQFIVKITDPDIWSLESYWNDLVQLIYNVF